MSATEENAAPCCCIQRLLLVHLKMEEIATGQSFDECASEQELGEQILYFYSATSSSSSSSLDQQVQHQDNNNDPFFGASNLAEAIRFVGVCSALYTLPTAIVCATESTTTATSQDRTTEVYLDHCTLVFVPLEDDPSILLVAQIGRKNSPGATPASVAAALRRTHLLFALLRGGGIHERLLWTGAGGNVSSPSCLYPGMDQLYRLRKQAREIRDRARRHCHSPAKNDTADDLSLTSELRLVEKNIVALQEALPIGPLRNDLALHYNAFLDEFNTLASFNLGAACSIVECLSAPIPLPRCATQQQTYDCGPCIMASSVLTSLNGAMKGYLEQREREPSSPWSHVFAVSLFVRGQLAWTEHSPAFHRNMTISNETTCLLMWYMASMRQKMNPMLNNHRASGSSSAPAAAASQTRSINTKLKQSLRPFGLSFGDHPPDIAIATSDDDAPPSSSRAKEGKGFLPAPPLSMLSVADDIDGFRGPLGATGLVWAPPVHLTTQTQQQQRSHDNNNKSNTVRSRICLFDHGDLSFLLHLDTNGDDDDAVYQTLLTAFAKAVDQAVTLAFPENKLGHPVRIESKTWKEAGQDIIFVDRQTLRVVIHASGAVNTTSSKPSGTVNRKGHVSSRTSDGLETSSLPGFDCRHYLASHFRLDSLLAFADAMNEVAQLGRTISKCSDGVGAFEMCSILPQGWMLAMAVGRCELYVLFDSSLYVTINDVQNAAARIRNEFLHGAI